MITPIPALTRDTVMVSRTMAQNLMGRFAGSVGCHCRQTQRTITVTHSVNNVPSKKVKRGNDRVHRFSRMRRMLDRRCSSKGRKMNRYILVGIVTVLGSLGFAWYLLSTVKDRT